MLRLSSILAVFLLALAATVARAQAVDADIALGDTFSGRVAYDGDVDAVRFTSLAGAKVTLTIKGNGKLKPIALLIDRSTDQLVNLTGFASGLGTKTFKIKKIPLPTTGLYELQVSNATLDIGTYKLTTAVSYPKALTSVVRTVNVGGGGSSPVIFDAFPLTSMQGSIAPAKNSPALPQVTTLIDALGSHDITAFIQQQGSKLNVKKALLVAFGSQQIVVGNGGVTGAIVAKLTLKHPKSKKKFAEAPESVVPGAITGSLDVQPFLALPEVEPNEGPNFSQFIGGFLPGQQARVSGQTGAPDFDSYRVTVSGSQTLYLTLLHDAADDFDIDVYDAAGAGTYLFTIGSSNEPELGFVDVTLPPGGSLQLDFDVYAFSGAGGYLFTVFSSALGGSLAAGGAGGPNVVLRPVAEGAGAAPRANVAAPARAQVDPIEAELAREFVEGEFVVQLKGAGADRAAFAAAHDLGIRIASPAGPFVATVGGLGGLAPADRRRATVLAKERLRAHPAVEFAELNYIRRATAVPSDTFYNLQWHYPQMQLPQAWDVTKGSANIVVAVIDTGITAHPDLNDRDSGLGYDLISIPSIALDGNGIDSNPSDPGDQNNQDGSSTFHGTHVAGTIGAETNNGQGVAGVDWNCRLMHLRVLGNGGGSDFDIAEAIRYAARLPNSSGVLPAQRANVMNLSLGGPGFSQNNQNAVNSARAAGVTVIAAAGNENSSQPSYPAAYAGAISVSAVTFNKAKAPYSNFGGTIDVAAPGGDLGADDTGDGYADGVLSTLPDESNGTFSFVFYQGTSMAAPHVAGLAALLLSLNPALSPDQVEQILESTAGDLGTPGFDAVFGNGLVNAFAAVKAVQGSAAPQLALTTSALDFGAAQTSLGVGINNAGAGALNWTATHLENNGGDWLSQGNSAGTAPSTLTLNVNRSGLAPGTYTAAVTVSSNGGNAQVNVSMTVAAAPATPLLSVSTGMLDFGAALTQLPATLQNAGGGTLSYSAVNADPLGDPWLSVPGGAGNLGAGAATALLINVNRAGFAPGVYTGVVTVTSNGGNAAIAVSMTVATGANPILSLAASAVELSSAFPQTSVAVGNAGGGTLNFTTQVVMNNGAGWLAATPAGSAPGAIAISVNAAAVPAGTYSGVINVLSNGGSGSIGVTFDKLQVIPQPVALGPLYVLVVHPSTLTTAAQGQTTQAFPSFNVADVPVGYWLVAAGPDLDNDGFICGIGEPCGLFPTVNEPELVFVPGGGIVAISIAVGSNDLLPLIAAPDVPVLAGLPSQGFPILAPGGGSGE